jgi:hypothetical protein
MEKKSETLTSRATGSRILVAVTSIMPMTIRAAIWARTTWFVLVTGSERRDVLLHHGTIVTDQSCRGRGERGKSGTTRVVVAVWRLLVVDRAYHTVLWIDVVGCLLSVGRIGVGGRDKGERIAGDIGVTVGGRVVQEIMSRGVVLGARVIGCVVAIVHGTESKVVAVQEMFLMRTLLPDCWNKFIDDRVQETGVCNWHLDVEGVCCGRSEQGGQHTRSWKGARPWLTAELV